MKLPFLSSSTVRNFVRLIATRRAALFPFYGWLNKRFFESFISPTQGILGLVFAVLGCGYVSTSDYLSHIKTITISPIEIQDPDFTFDASGNPHDETIRDALIDRFNQKWRDGNDAQLDVTILDYHLEPIAYDANNRPEEFRMSLEIEYEFKDRSQNKIIDRRDNYFQIHDFYVVSNRGEPPETREEAQARLIQELIDELYSTLAEQW